MVHLQMDTTDELAGFYGGDDFGYRVKRVDVLSRKGQQYIQTLTAEQAGSISSLDPKDMLSIFDANFDGYPDFSLHNVNGSYWNSASWFLFDPQRNCFVHNPVLSDANGPQFDLFTHTFHHPWRLGRSEFGHETYLWEEGKWVLIARETDIDLEGEMNDYETTLKVRLGEEMVVANEYSLGPCYESPPGQNLSSSDFPNSSGCNLIHRALKANPDLLSRLNQPPALFNDAQKAKIKSRHAFYVKCDTHLINPDFNGKPLYFFDIVRIDVYDQNSTRLIQSFRPIGCEDLRTTYHSPGKLIKLKDVNSDLYPDLVLPNHEMMYLSSFTFYRWHPETNLYQYDSTLSNTYSPNFDRKTRTVHHTWHIGVNYFAHEIYQWNGVGWELLAREEEMYIDEKKGLENSLVVRVKGDLRSYPAEAQGGCHHVEPECTLLERAMEIRKRE